jgi:uncharacterized membrane protein YecN with MAPEG domain
LEQLPIVLALTAALFQAAPRFALGLYSVFLVGRVLYQRGYASKGPQGRMAGAAVSSLTSLVAMVTAVVWGAKTLLAG